MGLSRSSFSQHPNLFPAPPIIWIGLLVHFTHLYLLGFIICTRFDCSISCTPHFNCRTAARSLCTYASLVNGSGHVLHFTIHFRTHTSLPFGLDFCYINSCSNFYFHNSFTICHSTFSHIDIYIFILNQNYKLKFYNNIKNC